MLLPRTPIGFTGSSLSRIINPTLPGRRCEAPRSGDFDATTQVLDWKGRYALFKLPSVFNQATGYVRRQLSAKELLSAMDVPASVLRRASEAQLRHWSRELTVPFKSRFEIIRSLLRVTSFPRLEPPPSLEESSSEPLIGSMMTAPRSQVGGQLERSPSPSFEEAIVPQAAAASHLKAAKSDDAEVPYKIWDERCRRGCPVMEANAKIRGLGGDLMEKAWSRFLIGARLWMLRIWKRRVASSFWFWWRDYHHRTNCSPSHLAECQRSVESGLAALSHSVDATWWEWDRGSAPFFWRYPLEWRSLTRDGLPPRFVGNPPSYTKTQKPPRDPEVRAKEKGKVSAVRDRNYVVPLADIKALLNFFSVSKGSSDIRMVYDGTASGLNEVLFAPWFALTTLEGMLRSVGPDTYSADNDYGEMFHNFWLHPELRKYCGIDLTGLFPEELSMTDGSMHLWEAWTRCAMGLRPSPYQAVQAGLQLKSLALGSRKDEANVFRWDFVRLNLPGDPIYDPTLPWVSKVRADGSTLAADMHSFVDDLRTTGPTKEETWLASSQVAKTTAYFGCQDAARKRRPPLLSPGAWAGSVIEATPTAVYKRVSLEQWEKTKLSLTQVAGWMNKDSSRIPRKNLERIRGFLVYVATTYHVLTPYLRGIHLTLDSWRPNRDEDGWAITSGRLAVEEHLLGSDAGVPERYPDAPTEVRAVPRLAADVAALMQLTSSLEPPDVLVRPINAMAVIFIYGDASGAGYGISLWRKGESKIGVEYGEWTKEYSEKSSNHREMYNFTIYLEKLLSLGEIKSGSEVFVFTDNQVTESAFFKGTSKSKSLFDLVLRLRRLEMDGSLFLRVVWVAGTRMIEQGTDGFSRGDVENGVATGIDMLTYVPLNETAFSRQANFEPWLRSTLFGDWTTLDATGWYDEGQRPEQFIWAPAPASADAALDRLCEAKHIRPEGSHVFVCPALLTPRWRRKLGKVADVVFNVPVGSFVWSTNQHEPLIIGLICPLLFSRPWQVRYCTSVLAQLRVDLPKVWSEDLASERSGLLKFWAYTRNGARV